MFSIVNDYKIAGISPRPSRRYPFRPVPPSHRDISSRDDGTANLLRFACIRSICLLVYRLDALRPASLVEKRGEDTEIEIPMCYLNGFDIFRHRLITDEQGNRRVCIFIEILLGVRIEGAVEIDLALRLPRRQLLVD